MNHCARLRAAAHGGQVLVSAVTADVLREAPPSEFSLRNLGLHQLKDIDRPEQVCQLLHPKLCADFPPLVSMSVQRHNLPNQLSSFVGRDRAIDELRRMLATRSLVSLTGPGGIGKTRLARRLAADMLAGYPDGIFLVTLAPLTAPNQVVPAIARTLGVRDQSGARFCRKS